MKPGYEISDYSALLYGDRLRYIVVSNFVSSGCVLHSGASDEFSLQLLCEEEYTTAIWTIKPKPCPTQS